MLPALALVASALAGTALPLAAQLISIKSVPIAEGEQFALFPSRNDGMGGVSIALDDTLAGPFRNPAATARLRGAHLFGSPALYSVSSDAGGGRTLPMAVLARSGEWFGGLSLAAQEIDELSPPFPLPVAMVDPVALSTTGPAPPPLLDKTSRHNTYVFGLVGRDLARSGLAVAASLHWSGLNVVDGVELLYAGSQDLRQKGRVIDARLGLLGEWEDAGTLEAVLVHNRYRMTHDVTYVDRAWDPVAQTFVGIPRLEHNPDRTDTWGVHVRYSRPVSTAGWRVGGILTANRMAHPKIPNYEIMSIPRDPGFSYAYNLGVGLSRTTGPTTLAMEVVYEPIWSDTWADAAGPVEASDGRIIPPGGKTIENDFTFNNVAARLGVHRDFPMNETASAGLQLGLALRSIHYWLEQQDNVAGTRRGLEEQWTEWTPTWGLSFRFPEIELRYTGRQTNGTGRPGVRNAGVAPPGLVDLANSGRSIIVAPSGPLTLDEVRVITHQVSISFPLW